MGDEVDRLQCVALGFRLVARARKVVRLVGERVQRPRDLQRLSAGKQAGLEGACIDMQRPADGKDIRKVCRNRCLKQVKFA